ncbi:hypothetical protein [Novosphingobium barchaimii]|uniref:hypothetical protein n=1 Tax=Novosphingobium barchaimii TaxID=1420591 RepID=UPI000A92FBF2|nr:hypothetical protein [Novosphingobium barchaimii]
MAVSGALLASSSPAAQFSDYCAVPALKPDAVLADKGYDGDAVREDLLWCGILPIIPPKANRRDPPACDFPALPRPQSRRALVQPPEAIPTQHTPVRQTAASFLGFLSLAAAKLWLVDDVNATQGCQATLRLAWQHWHFSFGPSFRHTLRHSSRLTRDSINDKEA